MSFASVQKQYLYVEVAYYSEEGVVLGLQVEESTVKEVLDYISVAYVDCKVGVNGKEVDLNHQLSSGDRIEIYPPLKVDPKVKRRRLVANRKKHS